MRFYVRFRALNVTNEASQPYFEHLLDNEIRLNGGFYSKEEKLKPVNPEERYDLKYMDRYLEYFVK